MVPARPEQVDQLDGSRYGGLNCTCAAGAMAIARATLNAKRPTGAAVRKATGDTSGGTNLRQVAAAAKSGWDVDLDVELGVTFSMLEQRLHAGQGAILQGWEAITMGTQWQASETFGGNHAWYVNDGRDWRQREDGLWIAGYFRVFDPLADGRRPAIAKSPFWIPRDVVMRWAGRLDVSDPDEPYVPLGLGRIYAAFTRDTEPHVHLRAGATKIANPFPDRMVVRHPRGSKVNVRRGPGSSFPVVAKAEPGDLFVAFQHDSGSEIDGVGTWYGDHNGARWINGSRLRGRGGAS